MPYQTDLLICIGNGSTHADQMANQIAKDNGLCYLGILDRNTTLDHGCWHTSIYDIGLLELKEKLSKFNSCNIIVLDQPDNRWPRYKDYSYTVDMAQALEELYPVTFLNKEMSNPFRSILRSNKSFCILPFVGIHLTNKTIRHCCWQKPVSTLSEYQGFHNDPTSLQLRHQMLRGEKNASCEKCYVIEDSGSISTRQDATLRWAYELNLKSYNDVVEKTKLINYEVVLGNECNSMCRMCSPSSSSLINNEYNKLGITNNLFITKNRDNLEIVDLDLIQRLQVVGGETTISPEFESFLQKCIKKERTDFEIFIGTNCYALSNRFLKLIKPFKKMCVGISIDGFQEVNRYIRWPIKWEKFCNNIKKLTDQIPLEQCSFNTTVSIYNISQLYEIYNYLDQHYPNIYASINFLTEPANMVPWNFPDKDVALKNLNQIKTLNRYKHDEIFQSRIDSLITKFSNSSVDLTVLADFFKFNDKLDQSRGVKLVDYIPELEHCRNYLQVDQ